MKWTPFHSQSYITVQCDIVWMPFSYPIFQNVDLHPVESQWQIIRRFLKKTMDGSKATGYLGYIYIYTVSGNFWYSY